MRAPTVCQCCLGYIFKKCIVCYISPDHHLLMRIKHLKHHYIPDTTCRLGPVWTRVWTFRIAALNHLDSLITFFHCFSQVTVTFRPSVFLLFSNCIPVVCVPRSAPSTRLSSAAFILFLTVYVPHRPDASLF